MRRVIFLVLGAALLLTLAAGCANPNALRLDVYEGYGEGRRLIRLNASSDAHRERICQACRAVMDSEELEKDPALFADYPEYRVEILGLAAIRTEEGLTLLEAPGVRTAVLVDLNDPWVDVVFEEVGLPETVPLQGEPCAKEIGRVYRSSWSSAEFRRLIDQD